jgi:hypothetical protein
VPPLFNPLYNLKFIGVVLFLVASGLAQRVVSLSCTPSTSIPAPTGYNFYRATVSGGPYLKQTATPVSTCGYTDASVINGKTYYYVATAVSAAGESVYSNETVAAIPTGPTPMPYAHAVCDPDDPAYKPGTPVVKTAIAGSSAMWVTMALGAYNSGKGIHGAIANTHHYVSNGNFNLVDTRPKAFGSANNSVIDSGQAWIVWDEATKYVAGTGTVCAPNVWVYLNTDSVVGNRAFFWQHRQRSLWRLRRSSQHLSGPTRCFWRNLLRDCPGSMGQPIWILRQYGTVKHPGAVYLVL